MRVRQWTLPARIDLKNKLKESETPVHHEKLEFQGENKLFPVYKVDIGFPCYRLANGRTQSNQQEIIAKKKLPKDFFTSDPDFEPALIEQDTILREMASAAGLLDILIKHKQKKPLILDDCGYVINGNRRLCIMRLLVEQDEEKYARFKHVEVIFLPPCSDRDIKEVEGMEQIMPEGRAEYSWVNEAMLYRNLQKEDESWNEESIARLYDKNVSYVRKMIAMLDDAEEYLKSRDKVGMYSIVEKAEFAIEKLQKLRKKFSTDELPQREFFSALSYLMLDDAASAKGRLYESIPDVYKYLDEIAESIREECSEDTDAIQKRAQNSDLNLLGESIKSSYPEVTEFVRKPENKSVVRIVIQDTLQEMRNKARERRDATYCRRQTQQAYTNLQSALSALDKNSDTKGIEVILKNIEQSILDMRKWLNDAFNKN